MQEACLMSTLFTRSFSSVSSAERAPTKPAFAGNARDMFFTSFSTFQMSFGIQWSTKHKCGIIDSPASRIDTSLRSWRDERGSAVLFGRREEWVQVNLNSRLPQFLGILNIQGVSKVRSSTL